MKDDTPKVEEPSFTCKFCGCLVQRRCLTVVEDTNIYVYSYGISMDKEGIWIEDIEYEDYGDSEQSETLSGREEVQYIIDFKPSVTCANCGKPVHYHQIGVS